MLKCASSVSSLEAASVSVWRILMTLRQQLPRCFRRSRSLSPGRREHVDIVHARDSGYLVQSLNQPSQIARRDHYTPAFLYLASGSRSGSPDRTISPTRDIRWKAVLQDVRIQFMEAMLRNGLHKDEDMEIALDNVVMSCKECLRAEEENDDDDDGEYGMYIEGRAEKKMWQKVRML
ncbi:hypothetical protein BC829DRAFT_198777 [Chytridium lagenaria]|nr:hypothetical protein BC829DRAFT_198777 [Chytridium lagenaria]